MLPLAFKRFEVVYWFEEGSRNGWMWNGSQLLTAIRAVGRGLYGDSYIYSCMINQNNVKVVMIVPQICTCGISWQSAKIQHHLSDIRSRLFKLSGQLRDYNTTDPYYSHINDVFGHEKSSYT